MRGKLKTLKFSCFVYIYIYELALKQIHQETLHEERKKLPCYNESVGSNNMIWSNDFFCICYHAGGSTKHLRWPKVKRRDEESSPSDALTPKKRKTRLAGKMRTNLWACPITPTPQAHLPAPCLCKIKMRESSKMA